MSPISNNIESKEEYWARVNQSISEIHEGKGITFTMAELETYIKSLVEDNPSRINH